MLSRMRACHAQRVFSGVAVSAALCIAVAAVPVAALTVMQPLPDAVDDGAFSPADVDWSQGATAAAKGTYFRTVLADSPAAFYKLDDGGLKLVDSGSAHLNGTYGADVQHAAPTLTSDQTRSANFTGGRFKSAALAIVTPHRQLEPSRVTVEAWIKLNALNTSNNYQAIVSFGNESHGQPYVIQLNAQSGLHFYVKSAGGRHTSFRSHATLAPGNVYHVVATYDGSTAAIYVDGKLDASQAGSGAPDYSMIASDGLAAGGALGGSRPTFNGSIADVAVYPRALSAATISKHYLAGVIQPTFVERPAPAALVVDSIGINTHFHFTRTAYNLQYAAVKSALLGLGVHHIRDGLIDTKWAGYYDRLNELGRAGVHSTLTTTPSTTMALVKSYPSRLAQSLEAFEGWNEPNLSNISNWASKTRAFQHALYATVKGSAALSHYAVIGPSVIKAEAVLQLGDIAGDVDYGNLHAYFDGYNPGTNGWGSVSSLGTYGSIPYDVNYVKLASRVKPVIATETGYGTQSGMSDTVTQRTQGIYMPRLFLEEFNHGLRRSFGYELLDTANVGTFNYFGLLTTRLAPKPAYFALRNMLHVLADTTSGSLPVSTLTYTVGGNVDRVHHTLMEKHDGTFVLALWLEVPSCSAGGSGTCRDIVNPSQHVTVSPQRALHSVALYTFDDRGNLNAAPATISSGRIDVAVGDHTSFLVFR